MPGRGHYGDGGPPRHTDAAFEKVLEGLPLPVAPPLELDDAGKNIHWAPTGEAWAALTRFEAGHKYEAREVGKVPDPAWVGAVCVDCCRTVDGAAREVTIYVW